MQMIWMNAMLKYLLLFLIACGTEKTQTVKIDVTDALCAVDTLNWVCARHCVKYPENAYCKRFDAYCMTPEGIADVEFCSWWAENGTNQ